MRCEDQTIIRREPRTSLRPSAAVEPEVLGRAVSDRPSSVTQAVRAAVRAIDQGALRPVARRDAGMAYEPQTLLALVSYCYARDIYGSADIEDVLRRDSVFRQLCQNEFPGARIIRRFRRENRETLHCCLTSVLRAVAAPMESGRGVELNEDELSEEASRRIMKAVFIDSMAEDDD